MSGFTDLMPDDRVSLRDYFAAAALTGLNSNSEFPETKSEDIARWSYEQADAMLAEREKKGVS